MLRKLLEERFHLVAHHETRLLPVYSLVVGNEGPKHLEITAPETEAGTIPGPIRPDGSQHWTIRGSSMADLAFLLGKITALDTAVVDTTGISGKFDLSLDIPVRDPETAASDYPFSVVFPAVYAQFGLRIVSRKMAAEVVVVDTVDKTPTEN
jgi:uncharacterized protein (TIGR03435 family)